MSTRCQIAFTQNSSDRRQNEALVYRHYDGGLTGAGIDLFQFFGEVRAAARNGDTRFDDAEYLAARFVTWQTLRYATSGQCNPLAATGVGVTQDYHTDLNSCTSSSVAIEKPSRTCTFTACLTKNRAHPSKRQFGSPTQGLPKLWPGETPWDRRLRHRPSDRIRLHRTLPSPPFRSHREEPKVATLRFCDSAILRLCDSATLIPTAARGDESAKTPAAFRRPAGCDSANLRPKNDSERFQARSKSAENRVTESQTRRNAGG
jgi:hypothetical protein